MLSGKESARREVEELTATIERMASFVGAQFIPDRRKTETFIAAREQRQTEVNDTARQMAARQAVTSPSP